MTKMYPHAVALTALLAAVQPGIAASANQLAPPPPPFVEPLDADTLDELKALYKQLIDAENRHDLAAVRPLIWASPSTLFVAKTATESEVDDPKARPKLARSIGDRDPIAEHVVV